MPGATIIADVKASQMLYDRIAELGGEPLMWKTGNSLIKTKMRETGAPLAGAMSGPIFFANDNYGSDDRTEESRVWNGGASTLRSRWSPYNSQNNTNTTQ